LAKSARTKENEHFLQELGRRVERLILEKGYRSPYDFWINEVDGEFSRATLNYLIRGEMDPKATTLRAVAKLLGVEPGTLFPPIK
jgi:transcriptional regulator with XRE-family HTH domain